MRSPEWKPVIIAEKNGFKFELSFEPDDLLCPKTHFMHDCKWSKEEYETIKNFYWFDAIVTPIKGSIRFDSCAAYLGANCYANKKEVMGNGELKNILSGYAPQMVEDALKSVLMALQED